MNQFKAIFLSSIDANDPRSNLKRVANSQKCIRMGGKHCDLENVGINFRHHTFFEMLGNWSFGDYFKKEAIEMAWDLLCNIFKLDTHRMFVTYFGGCNSLCLKPDEESKEIWQSLGLPKNKIIPLGIEDNFWEMGETGPCGVCTEIHYLLEPTPYDADAETLLRNSIEIWNLVFMQYEKLGNNQLKSLPKCHVDTGMGLERMTSVVQGVNSNYDTELFSPLFDLIEKKTGAPPYRGTLKDPIDIAYRILADHSRMFTVAIADGVIPDGTNAGHCLRRVIRRALMKARFVFKQELPADLLTLLTEAVAKTLNDPYPEIAENLYDIKGIVNRETKKFNRSIKRASELFGKMLDTSSNTFSGKNALQLHFQYGMPEDIIEEFAVHYDVKVDWNEFNDLYESYSTRKQNSSDVNQT
ncbi:alanine-tRNA ligase-like protein, partial [Dinothrombium tinctorium]